MVESHYRYKKDIAIRKMFRGVYRRGVKMISKNAWIKIHHKPPNMPTASEQLFRVPYKAAAVAKAAMFLRFFTNWRRHFKRVKSSDRSFFCDNFFFVLNSKKTKNIVL